MSTLKPKRENLFSTSLLLVFLVSIGVTIVAGTIFVIAYSFDLELAVVLTGTFTLTGWFGLFFLYLRIHYSKFSCVGGYFD